MTDCGIFFCALEVRQAKETRKGIEKHFHSSFSRHLRVGLPAKPTNHYYLLKRTPASTWHHLWKLRNNCLGKGLCYFFRKCEHPTLVVVALLNSHTCTMPLKETHIFGQMLYIHAWVDVLKADVRDCKWSRNSKNESNYFRTTRMSNVSICIEKSLLIEDNVKKHQHPI